MNLTVMFSPPIPQNYTVLIQTANTEISAVVATSNTSSLAEQSVNLVADLNLVTNPVQTDLDNGVF